MFFTRKYLYVLVSQWETGFYYYALGCTCSWDTTPQTHLSRRIENDFTPSLIYLLYLVLLSRGRSACLNNCLSSELPDHNWPEMSAGTVRVHLTCLWLRSIASCQRRNVAKYVKNGRILHLERQTKETEKPDDFYHLLSAKIISERLLSDLYRCQMSAWCNSASEDETAWYDCGLIGCWRVL